MSKSLGNFHKIEDVQEKGIKPLSLRYLFLQTHYHQQLNFTWDSVSAAAAGLNHLQNIVLELKTSQADKNNSQLSPQALGFQKQFAEATNDDLAMPQALAVMWEMLKSDLTAVEKLKLIFDWDRIFGLKLDEVEILEVPLEIKSLLNQREKLRQVGDFSEADEIREKIGAEGYVIEDSKKGYRLKKKEES